MTRQDQRGTIRNSQKDQNPSSDRDMTSWKPGSEAGEAKNVGAKGDFGVPVGAGRTPERDYVSANTKRSDPRAGDPVLGTVVSPSDDASTGADAQGGAAASNPSAGGDDSFAGEVSLGEAMGEDNPMPTAQP